MLDYVHKKAAERRITALKYIGAFSDGLSHDSIKDSMYISGDGCPELTQAYKDGKSYKKELTRPQEDDNLIEVREHKQNQN